MKLPIGAGAAPRSQILRDFGKQTPTKDDHRRLSYVDLRASLLSDADNWQDPEWLVQVGAIVRDRWLAEEQARGEQPFVEEEHRHLWDELTEGGLWNLQAKAMQNLDAYAKRSLGAVIHDYLTTRFKPIAGFMAGLGWVLMQAWRGFVGGVGLILLGLLLAAVAPSVVKSLRGAVDKALPEATAPTSG